MPSSMYYYNASGTIDTNISYTYDARGNISKITKDGVEQIRYTYDKLNRLTREDNKEFNESYVFVYDKNGNITSKTTYAYTTGALGTAKSTLAYTYTKDKLTAVGGKSCVYDAVGNPTTYKGVSATWSKGRKLTNYGGVVYIYDGQGRRTSNRGMTYTYDSADRLISSDDGLKFFYDVTGVAGFIYQSKAYFYRKDAQGNIIAILDSTGSVMVKYLYDAWGNHKVVDANGSSIGSAYHVGNLNPFRYRGYYYDKITGVYYLNSRYYDPVIGRFLNMDNVDYADPETLNGLNLYAYCNNNPVMYSDPTGHMPKWYNGY